MRKVTIYSTKTKAQQEIETGVTTWGELKQLVNPEMGVATAKCMVRENRTTLESNEAQLPQGDITIFVYPEKVKSGIIDDVYSPLSSAKLRRACQKKSLGTAGSDQQLKSKLRSYDKNHNISGPDAPKTTKAKARATTIKKKKAAKKVPTLTKVTEDTTIGASRDFDSEADEVADIEFHPRTEMLKPNSTISIHSVLKLMRNKFLNMFDDIEDQISDGSINSNEDILEDEAQSLAKEAGFSMSQETEEESTY